jgi:hypothetical protein
MNKGLARSANLSATSEFCTDKRFVGNDGHQYVIARGSEKAETKIVVDVTVNRNCGKTLARSVLSPIEDFRTGSTSKKRTGMFLFFKGVLEIHLNRAVCPFQTTVLAKLDSAAIDH